VATKPCALLGTRVSKLRMKCVRQRCHEAPGSVAAIASTRPGCAPELTSLTPARPRATKPRTNASQAAPSSAVTTSRPSDSRKPSLLTPTACTTQTLTVRPPSRHSAECRERHHGVPIRCHLCRSSIIGRVEGEPTRQREINKLAEAMANYYGLEGDERLARIEAWTKVLLTGASLPLETQDDEERLKFERAME